MLEEVGNELAQLKLGIGPTIKKILDEEGQNQIKAMFDKIFGTDVEKFASDWQEIQGAVGQLEQTQATGQMVILPPNN